jgi:hypothetical protein
MDDESTQKHVREYNPIHESGKGQDSDSVRLE